MIGLDQVAGWFDPGVVTSRKDLETTELVSADDVSTMLAGNDVTVIDVRGRSEWELGHLPGVDNIPVGYLTERLSEIPTSKPVVVYCQSGSRSAIAASVLQAAGLENVMKYDGGFAEWSRQKRPVERETPELVA